MAAAAIDAASDVSATSKMNTDAALASSTDERALAVNASLYKFVWGSVVSLNYALVPMVLVAIVLFVVIVATAFGNFLVGLSLFRYRYLRTISNYLIGNLALSDFLLATTVLPVSIFNECLGHWIFGEVACNAWLTMDVLYCTASLWNLCVIGFDRFTATLYPMWYRNNLSAKQAGTYVAFVWTIAAVICVPPVLGWNSEASNYVFDNATMVYKCNLFEIPSYVLYSACGSFYIPLLITSFFYARIFIALRQRMMKNRKKAAAARGVVAMAAKNAQQAPVGVSETAKLPPVDAAGLAEKNLVQQQSKKRLFGGSDSDLNEDDQSEDFSTTFTRATTSCGVGMTRGTSSTTGLVDATPVQSPSNDLIPCDTPTDTLTAISTIAGSVESNGPPHSGVSSFDIRPEKQDDSDFHQIRPSSNLSPDNSLDSKLNLEVSSSANPSGSKRKQPASNSATTGLAINTSSVAAVAKSFSPFSGGGGAGASSSRVKKPAPLLTPAPTAVQKSSSSANQRRYEQRELRATMRMGIIIAFFCGMWIGFFTVYVLKSWCPDSCPVPRKLDAFFFWLGYSNSSVNPILYTIFNDEFRRAFMKILGCYKKLGGAAGGQGAGGRGRDALRSVR